jgi:hypothetical protein
VGNIIQIKIFLLITFTFLLQKKKKNVIKILMKVMNKFRFNLKKLRIASISIGVALTMLCGVGLISSCAKQEPTQPTNGVNIS